MKLLRLTINNFLSFKNASIELDDKGLVAVSGKNLDGNGADSNGSGKSSLFIAIRWCLYGTTDKKLAADEIVNDAIGKNCSVITHWLDELTGIEYSIERYRKHTKHKNQLRFQTRHPMEAEFTDRTLGKNDLTQKSVDKAIGMDENVFLASCFASQEDALDIPAMKDTELKALLENALPFAKIDPLHKKYKAEWTRLIDEKSEMEMRRSSSAHGLNVTTDLLLRTLNEERTYLAGLSSDRAAIADLLAVARTKVDKLSKAMPDVPHLNALEAALQAKLEGLGISEAPVLEAHLRGLYSRQMDLDRTHPGKCPTCGSDFTDTAAVYAHQEKLSQISLDMASTRDKLNKLKESVPLRDKIDNKIAEVQDKIVEAVHMKDHISHLERTIKANEEKLTTLAVNPYTTSIVRLTDEVEKLTARTEEIKKESDKLNPQIDTYANLVEATSPKGFRYHMLESVTPALNRQTNYYLAMLTDGKIGAHWSTVTKLSSGEFKEAFSIKINMNGRTSFGSLSGGQKRKVRLACWFALQDMIADRAEKDVKLWVCDEVDGALDKAGIERLMSLLEEKARTKGTVLVISHNNLKDWIANGITVSMKDDVSEVSGFLNVNRSE